MQAYDFRCHLDTSACCYPKSGTARTRKSLSPLNRCLLRKNGFPRAGYRDLLVSEIEATAKAERTKSKPAAPQQPWCQPHTAGFGEAAGLRPRDHLARRHYWCCTEQRRARLYRKLRVRTRRLRALRRRRDREKAEDTAHLTVTGPREGGHRANCCCGQRQTFVWVPTRVQPPRSRDTEK